MLSYLVSGLFKRPRNRCGVAFGVTPSIATPGAREAFREAGEVEFPYLMRHLLGDWGEVDGHDRRANNKAIKDGTRILSAYTLPGGEKVWVITEADRSSTCLLLPSEY